MRTAAKTAKLTRHNEQLELLDACSLELLGVLALEASWLDRRRWIQRARSRGVRGPDNAEFVSTAEQLIAQLDARGLILSNPHGLMRAEAEVALATLARLHANGRLAVLAEPERARIRDRRRYSFDSSELAAELRVAVVEDDVVGLDRVSQLAERLIYQRELGAWLSDTFGSSPSSSLLRRLPEKSRESYLTELLTLARTELLAVPDPVLELAAAQTKALRLDVGRVLVLRGQAERALGLAPLPKYGAEGLSLLAAFWAGDYGKAAQTAGEVVAAMKSRKRKILPDLEGLCQVLAGLASSASDPVGLQAIDAVIDSNVSNTPKPFDDAHSTIEFIHAGLIGKRRGARSLSHTGTWYRTNWASTWVAALHDVWLGVRPEGVANRDAALGLLRGLSTRARESGYGPVARELDGVIAAIASESDDEDADSGQALTLASSLRAAAPWETALIGLDAIVAGTPSSATNTGPEQQLIWVLEVHGGFGVLTPRVRASSRSRKGKSISLSRLLSGSEDYLDADDQRVLAAAEPDESDAYYGRKRRASGRMVLGPRAIVALIGHPRVIDATGEPLRVVRGQPRLHTKRSGKGVVVMLEPRPLVETEVYCHELPDAVAVYERSEGLARAAQILGAGLLVPERGLARLQRTLARLCVAENLAVEGDVTPETEQLVADSRPLLLLGWDGDTLTARACVAPVGLDGPQLRPGIGNPTITAELREQGQVRLVRCKRDLVDERRRLDELERACPTLLSYAIGALEWRVDTLADALEVMLELGRHGDEVVLAWPKGRPLKPPSERDLKHLRLAVSDQRDWLGVEAGLELDTGDIASFRQLIESRVGSRFVRLDGERFLVLSEQLRRRLDALEGLATGKHEQLRATAVMLPLLDELTDGLDAASFDPKARAKLERIRELASASPRRPRAFTAQLRDYQTQGYIWMWRLAEAGLGACLADDMGLGKTVQALALLCQRASKGPALVVCPTSVVGNWVSESSRFAANLRVTVLAESGDRAATLAGLGRRDLLVCSYGVLASEAEALAEVEFATAVFDEAHALKNAETNRAKAARSIQAEFRLGLTGTPVENRVEELWSLFRVLTPGLLGSKAEFDERFAKPIARGDRDRTTQLRALLRPFLLRRTKGQVLDELPARTEITVHVDPRADERTYYEALRQRAVESVERGDPRKKRFRILAEITRLRQAAVDPRLLDRAAAPTGAKIDALVEQILALREEGHRALVFTQFLGSMELVRERFDAAEIEYLELDGSTPAAERSRRVDAFQAGEGDVFMLSLRAGGVGMNLTGADYVLHLDPWWNPAVEDQATDRAHRIGQTRPVTVYRLITRGSIEEKILALHERKRELADDILAGLEGAGALGLDELMGLL